MLALSLMAETDDVRLAERPTPWLHGHSVDRSVGCGPDIRAGSARSTFSDMAVE